MAGTESILGQYEATQNNLSASTASRVATDKDTFLKLLIAQLTHQDPMNPVEDKEFIAQLAQFTSVEELQNLNKSMESLNSAYLRQQSMSAVGLIGQYVEAPGDMVTIAGVGTDRGYSSPINFSLPRDTPALTMNVYAIDANGNPSRLVASRNLGSCAAGEAQVQWDGRDNNGNAMNDGVYIVSFSANDVDGKGMMVSSTSSGKVIRVEMSQDGNHTLVLQDLRTVKFNDVTIVDDPAIYEGGGDAVTGDGTTTTDGDGTTTGGTTPEDGATTGDGTTTGDGATSEDGTA
jgi:flagellar basal-body rod modification protein FlgD